MNYDDPILDIIGALRQIARENYLSEYTINQDRLEQIKTIKEPVLKRLAINLNKYHKAVAPDKTCLRCGKIASMYGFTWFLIVARAMFCGLHILYVSITIKSCFPEIVIICQIE